MKPLTVEIPVWKWNALKKAETERDALVRNLPALAACLRDGSLTCCRHNLPACSACARAFPDAYQKLLLDACELSEDMSPVVPCPDCGATTGVCDLNLFDRIQARCEQYLTQGGE